MSAPRRRCPRAPRPYACRTLLPQQGQKRRRHGIPRRGIDLTQPNRLFVQPWVYQYAILDEFAINAYWAGAYRESLDASPKLLASDKLPASMAKRIAANARSSSTSCRRRSRPTSAR